MSRQSALPLAFQASYVEIGDKEVAPRECVFDANEPGAKKKWASLSFPLMDGETIPKRPPWVVVRADGTDGTFYEFRLDTPRLQARSEYTADGETFQPYVTYRRWDTRKPQNLREPFKILIVS